MGRASAALPRFLFGAAAKGTGVVTERPHKRFRGFPDGFIIVNNCDHWSLRQSMLPGMDSMGTHPSHLYLLRLRFAKLPALQGEGK